MTDTGKVFFTADLHLWHKKMALLRGYESVEAMTWAIVDAWNEEIFDPTFDVYLLGDVSLGNNTGTLEALEELEGRIHLIRGNHDFSLPSRITQRFSSIEDVKLLKLPLDHALALRGKVRLWLSHYRHVTWPESHYGSLHLHGHSHGMLQRCPDPRALDVGMDAMQGAVVSSLSDVLDKISAQVAAANGLVQL